MEETAYRIVDWDSENFGYKVAKLQVEGLNPFGLGVRLADLRVDGIRLVYVFADPADESLNSECIRNGGFLADEKVTFLAQVPLWVGGEDDFAIKSYLKKGINDQLLFLSLEAGSYSRYRIDQNFRSGEFENLYSEWMKKSLNGEIAKDVLVYEEKGKEIGFITLGERGGRCNIGLIAVDPNKRGSGIGGRLVKAVFKKAFEWGCGEIDVVTQMANERACSFYQKEGFKLESVVNIYHFWL